MVDIRLLQIGDGYGYDWWQVNLVVRDTAKSFVCQNFYFISLSETLKFSLYASRIYLIFDGEA